MDDDKIAALREKYGERNVNEKGQWTGGEGRKLNSPYMVLPHEFGGERGAFEEALKAENYKKEVKQALKETKSPAVKVAKSIGGGGGLSPVKGMTSNPNFDMKKGGTVRSSASKRADGCCVRGKTRA